MSGSASVTFDDGSTWKTDGPLKEILSVFNGGSPLNIVNGVKSVISDGFTVMGKAQFMGDEEATINATVMKNGDITLTATHPTLAKIVGRNVPADITVTAVAESPTDLFIVRRFEGGTEPLEQQGTQAQLLRTSIHTIAMDEEGFWETLSASPKSVLEQRLALKVPPEVNVKVLTETAKAAYLVLHHPPHLQGWQPPAQVMQHVAVKK